MCINHDLFQRFTWDVREFETSSCTSSKLALQKVKYIFHLSGRIRGFFYGYFTNLKTHYVQFLMRHLTVRHYCTLTALFQIHEKLTLR